MLGWGQSGCLSHAGSHRGTWPKAPSPTGTHMSSRSVQPARPRAVPCHLSVFTKIKWSHSIRRCHYCLHHAISTINNLLYLLGRQKGQRQDRFLTGGKEEPSRRAGGQSRAGRFARDPAGTAAAPEFAGGRWHDGRLRRSVPVPFPVPGRAEPPPGRRV